MLSFDFLNTFLIALCDTSEWKISGTLKEESLRRSDNQPVRMLSLTWPTFIARKRYTMEFFPFFFQNIFLKLSLFTRLQCFCFCLILLCFDLFVLFLRIF